MIFGNCVKFIDLKKPVALFESKMFGLISFSQSDKSGLEKVVLLKKENKKI